MEFLDSNEIDLTQGVVCRASRVGTTLGGLIMSLVLCGAPVFWWYVEAPAVIWILCAGLAALVFPAILGTVVASLRSSNWLLLVRSNDLVINTRSYANSSPEHPSSVIVLPFKDIESAREVREFHKLPESRRGGGTVHSKQQFLELQIHPDIELQPVRKILADERNRPGSVRTYFGGLTVRSKFKHDPVTLPADDVIRITWRSHMDAVVPKLQVVLDRLAVHVDVTPTFERRFAQWHELDDQEFDDLVLQLAMQGRTIDAAKLLSRRRGFSITEAKRFVDELRSAE